MGEMTEKALQSFIEDREKLIAAACRIVESRAIAEELVQDSWLRWQQRDYPPHEAKPIFRSIVANLARDWLRRQRTETRFLKLHAALDEDRRDAERIVIARQDLARIVSALDQLPTRTVTAFRMSRVDGLTYAEIAKRLDTVPSRVHGYIVKAIAHVTLSLME
ncbi:MAG: sigma-70 family RNA polymerase sigma factor [Pseudomonadota bacterium]